MISIDDGPEKYKNCSLLLPALLCSTAVHPWCFLATYYAAANSFLQKTRIREYFLSTQLCQVLLTLQSTKRNRMSSLALSHWTAWLLESPPWYFRIVSISRHGMHPSVNSCRSTCRRFPQSDIFVGRICMPLCWHLIVLFFYKLWEWYIYRIHSNHQNKAS